VRVAGLPWREAGRFLARESLAYWCLPNNWGKREPAISELPRMLGHETVMVTGF